MKWFVIVVIFAAMYLKIEGLKMNPNVKFGFKQLTSDHTVDYTFEKIRETYSNLQISQFYDIKLKELTYLKKQHGKLVWSLLIEYKKNVNVSAK